MENIGAVIAKNLIYLRHKASLTQQELANKINYSDNAISRWERNEATPTIETLSIIASYFGVSVNDLIDENFQTNDAPKPISYRVQRLLVILFSVSVIWSIALIGFIYTQMFSDSLGLFGENNWLLFVISVPVTMMILYYYNRLWGNKVYHLVILSVFWWSLITTLYLYILLLSEVNLWLIFLLGVPIELAQLLWYFVRR